MPFTSLSGTPTSGADEVLATLLYMSAGPEDFGKGVTVRDIALNLQRNGHYGLHSQALTTLEAEVQTVVTALVGAGKVKVATAAREHGYEGTTAYQLTRAGVLPARRAQPYALRP